MTTTQTATGCTCGKCSPAERDSYGNVDYGMEWSDARCDYVPRDCSVAASRRSRSEGENYMIEHGS